MAELRRRGIRELDPAHAGQTPVNEVRDHQKTIRRVEDFGMVALQGEQLKERVDLHELRAALREDFRARDLRARSLEQSARPRIAIRKWQAEHFVRL